MVQRDVDGAPFGSDAQNMSVTNGRRLFDHLEPVLESNRQLGSADQGPKDTKDSTRKPATQPPQAARRSDRDLLQIRVGKFVDQNAQLAEQNVGDLFRYIWSRVESKRMIDIVLDMSGVDFIDGRFREELEFLRRHGRSRSIRVVITGPR